MSFLLPAFLLGLLGSMHCVGMCGPIALAIPVRRSSGLRMALSSLIYNTGRASTYAIMGAVSGSIGLAVKWAGGQQMLSILCGSLIIFFLFAAWLGKKLHVKAIENGMMRLKKIFGSLFKEHIGSVFLLGLLNGFLPCGLVYAGLAGAAATGGSLNGAVFMFFFGMGTFPAMSALMLAGMKFPLNWRNRLNKMVPVFLVMMAMILILRGLELGIPLISPKAQNGKITCPYCAHHKN